MASASRRTSNFPPRHSNVHGRPGSSDQEKEEIWKPMLDNISSGKRLPEKSLLVLGGTPATQREFLESVATDPSSNRRPPDRGRKPPIANQFALGYTYQDVLDSDHEDTLARLSLYLLANPSPSFTPLIKPYLNPKTLPHMLVVVLLDWNRPWLWIRQLRDWIRVLRSLILSLDDASKEVLEENIALLQDKGRGLGGSEGTGSSASDNIKVPMGPGEWDEPLGIPLCVVCQNADKIEALEKERGWKEEEFDFILQYMRTILLKHGASLVYTMPSAPGSLQTLIHSTLGIKSLLKQKQLKHNVIDRDRVLVPPNWDSWGKIRILREGFDVEGVSEKWSVDIDIPQHVKAAANGDAPAEEAPAANGEGEPEKEGPSATSIYEETIRNPEQDFPLSALHSKQANGVEVASKDAQTFLAEQLATLEVLRREDDNEQKLKNARKKDNAGYIPYDESSGVVEEHIGPVQFNMGGIQVNADEMVKRLQDREANRTASPDAPTTPPAHDPKMDNDKLASFFAGLINKGTNSASNSPRAGS
ncbi:dynein light intermediate chain-domain-containing protein [Clohesyomyces aquaticus]|uniref:Dynein light intermediate chain-domain-containing protein n=1 Tax=Clohesyomyces aquaticus TaxID=1231657 RepID=A0A1Y2A3Z7_9PLEO|nr:dynein light intermediate chain-domain-containing protein [Clohesyomyces aquaticus]